MFGGNNGLLLPTFWLQHYKSPSFPMAPKKTSNLYEKYAFLYIFISFLLLKATEMRPWWTRKQLPYSLQNSTQIQLVHFIPLNIRGFEFCNIFSSSSHPSKNFFKMSLKNKLILFFSWVLKKGTGHGEAGAGSDCLPCDQNRVRRLFVSLTNTFDWLTAELTTIDYCWVLHLSWYKKAPIIL